MKKREWKRIAKQRGATLDVCRAALVAASDTAAQRLSLVEALSGQIASERTMHANALAIARAQIIAERNAMVGTIEDAQGYIYSP